MVDATQDLTLEALKKNFAYWLGKWRKFQPVAKQEHFSLQIPVTHTFGAWKKWGNTPDCEEFPYENILFRDRRLISDYHRWKKSPSASKKLTRRMSRARKVKLDRFVFSYFGIHDPYYARSGKIDVGAFGVFLKTDLEVFPRCNATRRDLNSHEAEWPPDREFLLADDARLVAQQQVRHDKRHHKDFWHYWGNARYFKNRIYAKGHWSWKVELHFHEAVSIRFLAAILWPYEICGHSKGAMRRKLIGGNDAKGRFERICPTCKVIPYYWAASAPTMSLVRASFAAVRYLTVTGKYPESADDAFQFFKL